MVLFSRHVTTLKYFIVLVIIKGYWLFYEVYLLCAFMVVCIKCIQVILLNYFLIAINEVCIASTYNHQFITQA